MFETNKSYVSWAFSISLLLIGWAAIKGASAYRESVSLSSNRSFTVSGEGKVVAIPDIATFSVGVIVQGGTDIAKLQKESTEKNNAVIAFLKSKNVAKEDIKTENHTIEPRQEYAQCFTISQGPTTCPPPKIVGYTITDTISVKIRNFETIGEILTGVVGAGANTVSQLSFGLDDPKSAQAEARTQAIAEAEKKAQAIARSAGFRIGKLVSIDEGSYNPAPLYRYEALMSKDAFGGATALPAQTVEAGSQNITSTVTIRYEIK